jgi:hypothetical protein
MKTRITNSSLILTLAACGIIFFAGCASMETDKTQSLLSQAGFRTRTPQTAKQRELYAFKDEKAGVAYIGGESEHQKYLQICRQQHLAEPPEEEMNHPFAQAWSNQWGGGRDVGR